MKIDAFSYIQKINEIIGSVPYCRSLNTSQEFIWNKIGNNSAYLKMSDFNNFYRISGLSGNKIAKEVQWSASSGVLRLNRLTYLEFHQTDDWYSNKGILLSTSYWHNGEIVREYTPVPSEGVSACTKMPDEKWLKTHYFQISDLEF